MKFVTNGLTVLDRWRWSKYLNSLVKFCRHTSRIGHKSVTRQHSEHEWLSMCPQICCRFELNI